MYCNKCGAKIPDDAKFCGSCGNQIAKEAPEQRAEPAGWQNAFAPGGQNAHYVKKSGDRLELGRGWGVTAGVLSFCAAALLLVTVLATMIAF